MKEQLPLLVVATRNSHKTDEIRSMLEGVYIVRDLSTYPEAPPVEETGTTFSENAALKAVSASQCIPGIVLADDSGLEVDALGGRPGVWSSRFGGEEGNHSKNNERMILELKQAGVSTPDQTKARFRCVMVLAQKGKILAEFSGVVEGHMILEKRGKEGFGYDPLFVPEGYDQTFAELPGSVKNSMSHRGRALQKAIDWLQAKERQI